jgi:hypothetical protein
MPASSQLTLWGHNNLRENLLLDAINGLGPYRVCAPEDVCRHLTCANYDGCLTFAANRKWPSFSCQGCRKAQHGVFVQEA